MTNEHDKKDANRDPITGTPGAHPGGVAAGSLAGGAVAGAVAGTVAGPVGTAVGAAVGAVVGGLAGKGIAERIDPTVEDAYWRENHTKEAYYDSQRTYDDYGPAYRAGYEGRERYADRSFDEAEPSLRSDYEANKGRSQLAWDDAKQATRSAWDRVERALPGDADRDGR